MSVLRSVVQWAANELIPWQSDAVRRILTQESIEESDISELTLMIKERHGLKDPDNLAPHPQRMQQGQISGVPHESSQVLLKAMKIGCNVNAIPDGSFLPFGHEGLTVVYGENGSGKSGYARVLKRACNARDTKESILPDAFAQECSGPAMSEFKISVNGEEDILIEWVDGEQETPVLSNICVFDSKCARVIVDENNQVTYLPYGASVFESLVSLLNRIRTKLDNEKPFLQKPLFDEISKSSKTGEFVSNLSHKTSFNQIETASQWTEEDEKLLKSINKKIADAEASDPEKHVLRLRNLKNRIIDLLESIIYLYSIISDKKYEGINTKIKNHNHTKKARIIASQESLSKEPLPGAGEAVWQKLYDAARRYSIEYAYPDHEFPMTGDDSLCVLCMQPLLENAKDRMIRFKKFMEDTTQKNFEDAINDLKQLKDFLESVKIPDPEKYQDALDEIKNHSSDTANQIKDLLKQAQNRIQIMINSVDNKIDIDAENLPDVYLECPAQIAGELEKEAKDIEKNIDPEALSKLKNEQTELSDRKQLSNKSQVVKKYVQQLKDINKYDACLRETATRGITEKGKNILKKALTPELMEALKSELEFFEIEHLRVNLKPTGRSGETRHKMELANCQPSLKAKLSEILSEGEQHVLAIAGFLAELKISNTIAPIVFDDPVCSLDHLFRAKIAHRLAKEAAKRQVVVFTHDISFLLELETKCGELQGTYFFPQTLRRIGNDPGKCTGGLPWHAMSVKEKTAYINGQINESRALFNDDKEAYNAFAGRLYGLLREAWESFIEDTLLQGTVRRHGSEIQTLKLSYVTVTDDDYRTIHLSMGKCSKWMFGHDKSEAIDTNRPSPDEMQSDVKTLSDFAAQINRRKEGVRKQRMQSLKAPKPEVG